MIILKKQHITLLKDLAQIIRTPKPRYIVILCSFFPPYKFLNFYTIRRSDQQFCTGVVNHLQLSKTEFTTCMRRRMLDASAAEVVGRFRWWPSI